MTKQFQILQRRFGGARPGLQLIAIEDAAIPVTVVRADVLAQEKKELPIAEEFTLRFVDLDVDTPEEIAAFLGLEPAHVLEAAVAQLAEKRLHRNGSGNQLALTLLGSETVSDLAATQPVLRQLPITFDRLTWTLADYPERSLIEKKDAQARGLTVLPAARKAHIGLDDVTPSGFNALLKGDKLQVLRIHKVIAKKHRYLPVKLLVYGDPSRRELELAICVDDDLSTEHGLALDRIEAVKLLGLEFGEPESRPILPLDLEGERDTTDPEGDADDEVEPINGDESTTARVRPVNAFEHTDLLTDAITTAEHRLLIVSPQVRDAVVTTDFVTKLEQRLKAGVDVTIALGHDDSKSDDAALRRIQNLADVHNRFTLAKLKGIHEKTLLFDDHWITTTFNWLSFRNETRRTYRMEEGTLVSIASRVDTEYERYRALINNQQTG